MKRRAVLVSVFLVGAFFMVANNLQIGTPVLTTNNELMFSVSWDNSWYTSSAPHNWDGVYLFVKYRNCASTNAWSHAILSTNKTDHYVDSPMVIDNYKLSDGRGVIIRRDTVGYGHVNVTVKLKLVTPGPGASYDFLVFGIEMVWIPQGGFYVGDGASRNTITSGATNNPLYIGSEDSIARGTLPGQIYCNSASTTVPADIPANYPKGYTGFYVMKYEITQGQYVAFLNTLSSDQAANRVFVVNANRVHVGGSWPNYVTNYPHRAMNNLSGDDLKAYLDWAALRPMTELEYEKICRGPNYPVASEAAWGTSIATNCNTFANDGTALEKTTTPPDVGAGRANFGNDVILGPVRVGFASDTATDRLAAGASYYGVMELSGNVWELCVNIYHADGRNFQNINGDGELSGSPSPGFANTTSWPPSNTGFALRGGAWSTALGDLRVSDRYYYTWSATGRNNTVGGRGIR